VKDFKGNDVRFTYYFLHTLNLKQFDTGTSNPTLNRNLVHALNVGIPQLDEQREIAVVLQSVDHKIDIHESKKRSLQDLFKTTLHKLMTAQIRVNDLDIDTGDIIK
jgi:type I restriction enzyme S subunit